MLRILSIMFLAVLTGSGIGFGASLNTTPEFNLIGASDNNVVPAARANLTEIIWNEEISITGEIEMDEIVFTVGNEDTVDSHAFQVCAVIEGPVAIFSPSEGSPPACTTTASIAPSGTATGQIISFANPVRVSSIVDFSFSVEEIS